MIDDPRRPPASSIILGYGPALVLVGLAVAAWAWPALPWLPLGQLWAAAILLFLSGVRRGLSFFTPGGQPPLQVAAALLLFALGLTGLLLPGWPGLLALAAGYAIILALDPLAARKHEAPRHFAALRPPQMALCLAGLALLLARTLA